MKKIFYLFFSGFLRIFDAKGRSPRSEYICHWITIMVLLAIVISIVIFVKSANNELITEIYTQFYLICVVIMIGSGISMHIRRMHDIDTSAWALILFLIPIIGPLYFLYLCFKKGTNGPNRFG